MGFAKFSYDEYLTILEGIIATGKYCDYADVVPNTPFIVMRHDVEFSPERALQMQKVENSLGFKSSYFFQIANNTYNAFSGRNVDIIKEIHANGHHIGFHYHPNGKTNITEIKDDIRKQVSVMSDMLGISIDRMNIHRPTKEVLRENVVVDNLINTYSPLYFTFAENVTQETKLDVKYIADSLRRWNYGFPDRDMLSSFQKIQILIHPYNWSSVGYDNLDNFRNMISEKNAELIDSIDSECKYFGEVRDAL